jgi:hypothetical protein
MQGMAQGFKLGFFGRCLALQPCSGWQLSLPARNGWVRAGASLLQTTGVTSCKTTATRPRQVGNSLIYRSHRVCAFNMFLIRCHGSIVNVAYVGVQSFWSWADVWSEYNSGSKDQPHKMPFPPSLSLIFLGFPSSISLFFLYNGFTYRKGRK